MLDEAPAVWARSGYRYRVEREFPILNGTAGQFTPFEGDLRRSTILWDLGGLVR
jgi:hypothetical protein